MNSHPPAQFPNIYLFIFWYFLFPHSITQLIEYRALLSFCPFFFISITFLMTNTLIFQPMPVLHCLVCFTSNIPFYSTVFEILYIAASLFRLILFPVYSLFFFSVPLQFVSSPISTHFIAPKLSDTHPLYIIQNVFLTPLYSDFTLTPYSSFHTSGFSFRFR